MKKIYTFLSVFALAATAFAQHSPDRVIIKETNGLTKSYLAERIDEMVFEKVDGDVRADVKVLSFTEGNEPSVTVEVTRTPECQAFKIAVVPPSYGERLKTDADAALIIDYLTSQYYYEDFSSGKISGFESPFISDVEYTVFTVGYDKFGTACAMSKDTFKTAKPAIVGNPQVSAKVIDTQARQFTMEFEGNSDCGQYFLCAFSKTTGGLQAEFETWAPMFGFNTPNEMIAFFAQESHVGKYTNTWTNMDPGTDYEVWVAIQDTKGNYAEPACFEVSTAKLGDEGLAEVTITVGSFTQDTDPQTGALTYYQQMIYKPNKSCSFFRDILVEKSYVENFNVTEKIDGITATGEEGIIEYLKTDQPMNPYWNLYETDDWKWEVKPGTAYKAYAIGMNAKDEWGTLATQEFTTLGSSAAPAAKAPAKDAVTKRAAMNGTTCGTAVPAYLRSFKKSEPTLR